jgi:DNA repair protein RecN (Recombination protein N)
MLRFLRITHLAVIDTVEVEFGPGLNVLTGETGAGKSILVHAVGLLLGGRATGEMVRTGEEAAVVEAVFEETDGELLVRREVTSQGRSRAFLDGTLVTASALRDRMSGLMEIHGQHEHQTLVEPAAQIALLDLCGGLQPQVSEVAEAFGAWSRASAALEALSRTAADADARRELAAFQLAELERAGLAPGEDEALTAERQVLANAERLERLCGEARALLYDSDHAVLASLGAVWRKVGEVAALDAQFAPYLEQKAAIKAQLEDLAETLRRYTDRLEVPPGRLQQVEDRLALLERLKRKHGPALSDVVATRDRLKGDLAAFGASEERLAALQRDLDRARERYAQTAARLSSARKRAAAQFATQVETRLRSLAMEKVRFEVRFLDAEAGAVPPATPQGTDRVEFVIAPNPGEDPRPLARTASGGELSRLMLAIKTLAAGTPNQARQQTGMVFDEVDAGIGGAVADVVGAELKALGASAQVLCITHLPQVAAYATTHFRIAKSVVAGRTVTSVARLDGPGRVEEVARMIGGTTITEGIRRSAAELLARRQGEAKGEHLSKGESESAVANAAQRRNR